MIREFWIAIICSVALLSAAPVDAQYPAKEIDDTPLVEKLTLRGVESVDRSELRESLATRASSCRSFLVRPFCWFSDSHLWVEKRYLEPGQIERDELRIRVFYWLRGYRDVQVISTVEPAGDGVAVTFAVAEGEPTRVAAIEVEQTDSVLSREAILEAGVPEIGDPLNLVLLDSAQARVRRMLWHRGYGDATVLDSAWVPEEGRGAVGMTLIPGPKTTIGEIVVLGNEKVSDRTIRSAIPIDPGELYRHEEIRRSQRALYRTGMFREAQVRVPPQEDSAKLVEVFVRERPLRTLRAGVGFNTIEFVQAEAGVTRWNWPFGGSRVDLRGTVGNLLAPQLNGSSIFEDVTPAAFSREREKAFLDPAWQVSAELKQPIFRAVENTVGLGVFAHRRIVPQVAIDRSYGANASFTHSFEERVSASALYHFEVTRVEAADVYYCVNFGVCQPSLVQVLREGQRLSPFGLDATVNRADNPLDPREGYTIELDAEHASELTLSDFRYNRAMGEAAAYLPLGPGVLAGHVRAGWVRALASTAEALGIEDGMEGLLHPRIRFYAGGARSVRGYRANQLGPRVLTIPSSALRGLRVADGDTTYLFCPPPTPITGCDPNAIAVVEGDTAGIPSAEFDPRPLGGSSLLEGSIEYRFPLFGNFTGALFVDAGRVGVGEALAFASSASAVTPGFGVRYRASIGAVRVDVGIRPLGAEALPVVTEIPGEDGQRRIVVLSTPKSYDPLEGSDGFFAQVLNRLTLHLAIGQAY